MALTLRLPFTGWAREKEEVDARIVPDPDINPHAYSRQDYLLAHLERYAPEHIGSTNRIGTAIRHSPEAVELISKLNATWSRERGA